MQSNVEQQFTVARTVMQRGLHPIIEPEVDIKLQAEEKQRAEAMLKAALLENLNKLHPTDEKVLLKLTLPTVDNFYKECIDHPNVLRVVALSGGYDRKTANSILARNENVVASFSRALTEGLSPLMTRLTSLIRSLMILLKVFTLLLCLACIARSYYIADCSGKKDEGGLKW